MNLGLLLIDLQNDYFPGGKNELFHPEDAAKKAQTILTFFRQKKLPIYHVQHISTRPNASFFLPDSEGIKFHKTVKPLAHEPVIIKHVPNSFNNTNLLTLLNKDGITDLVICGMMTHICIDTTVRAAKSLGFHITLIEDACATKDLIWKNTIVPAHTVQHTYLASLNTLFADIQTSTDWLYQNS